MFGSIFKRKILAGNCKLVYKLYTVWGHISSTQNWWLWWTPLARTLHWGERGLLDSWAGGGSRSSYCSYISLHEEALLAVYCSNSRKFRARVKEAQVQCKCNFSLQQNLNTGCSACVSEEYFSFDFSLKFKVNTGRTYSFVLCQEQEIKNICRVGSLVSYISFHFKLRRSAIALDYYITNKNI